MELSKYASYVPNSTRKAIAPTRVTTIGSIDTLNRCTNIIYFNTWGCYDSGSINTCFASMYKISHIECQWRGYGPTEAYGDDWSTRGNLITGNISVFADKYDLGDMHFDCQTLVSGQYKDLKNLKKLYGIEMEHTQCTGCKSDLYNNGANITYFVI